MFEAFLRDFLQKKLAMPVLLERGEDTAPPFFLVEKTGSGEKNHLLSGVFAIQSYGNTLFEAAKGNALLHGAMEELKGEGRIARVECISDYNFTDPQRKEYRYQAVYQIFYY